MNLATLLRTRREALNLSRLEVAHAAKCSVNDLTRLEFGDYGDVSIFTLGRLAFALKLDMGEMLAARRLPAETA